VNIDSPFMTASFGLSTNSHSAIFILLSKQSAYHPPFNSSDYSLAYSVFEDSI